MYLLARFSPFTPFRSYGTYYNGAHTAPHLIHSPQMSYATQTYSPGMIHQRSPAYAVMLAVVLGAVLA